MAFEPVDLLINYAGQGGVRGPFWEVDLADARAHFDVQLVFAKLRQQ